MIALLRRLRNYLHAAAPPAMDDALVTLKTFRYVRLTIVAMTCGLLASLVIEIRRAGCTLESVSAYYYTPARGMFTGALIAIGVCLIALRDPDTVKDNILNAAGLFAPLVALIPMDLRRTIEENGTQRPNPDATCIQPASGTGREGEAFGLVTAGREATIDNNFWSLIVVLVVVWIALFLLIGQARRNKEGWRPAWWPWLLGVAATVALVAYHELAYPSFLRRMHFTSAILLFFLVAVYAVVDGMHARSSSVGGRKRGVLYVVLGLGIIVGCIVLKVSDVLPRYNTLLVELYGITLFLIFWIVQSIEFWNHPTRAAALRSREVTPPSGTEGS